MTKQCFTLSLLVGACLGLQTTRSLAQESPSVIIKATQVMTPRESGEDDPNPPQETNIVIQVKGSHIRQESKSDASHSITIIDKDAKKTTNLYEQAGRKYGYYSIDTPRTVRPDSAGNQQRRPTATIEYIDSTKTIAGYNCKKAVATMSFGGRTMSSVIWYTNDLPIKQPITGGRGFGMMGANQLQGFPMAYSISLPNGASITYQVTKVDANAKISDTEFDIPKGYDVKPESERPRGNFGGFRGGGGPGGARPDGN